jgi:hypothetical protein
MTIDIWVKTTDIAGNIVSKPWNSNGEYNFSINYYQWWLQAVSTKIITFTSLATGNWENVTCIATPTQSAVYRNGTINTNFTNHNITSNSPSNPNGNTVLSLMTVYPYGTGTWNIPGHAVQGNLAIVRIYNKVLSANEVSQNYNSTRHRFGL